MANDNHGSQIRDVWASGAAYESYVGRWSVQVAIKFIEWLGVPPSGAWLDVGCGTGALTRTILERAAPSAVKGIDRSEGFISLARRQIADKRAKFELGDAQDLPVESAAYDAVVSGLMLNFVPNPERAIAEMIRACKPGGVVALYVWDYADKMQFMRHFWNAAAAVDPPAAELDEGRRFPLSNPGPLASIFEASGLGSVAVAPLDIWTEFRDFDDFWSPFLLGQGPAPSYVMSLGEDVRAALRERLHAALPIALDGSIPLMARAWAVRGVK